MSEEAQSLTGVYNLSFLQKDKKFYKTNHPPTAQMTQKTWLQKPEKRMESVISNRKKLGLSGNDFMILMFLVLLSSSRVIIHSTPAQLSEDLGIHLKAVYRSLGKLIKLSYIRKVRYKDTAGIMVDPAFTTTASAQRKAFRFKLWVDSEYS